MAVGVETGDRVRFKAKGLPRLKYQSPAHAASGNDGAIWQEHFGGLTAVVVAVDGLNGTAVVRGKDRDGHPFTVELSTECLTVTARAADGGV